MLLIFNALIIVPYYIPQAQRFPKNKEARNPSCVFISFKVQEAVEAVKSTDITALVTLNKRFGLHLAVFENIILFQNYSELYSRISPDKV